MEEQIVCTIKYMEIAYDPKKNSRKIALRGLSFDRVAEFDFDTARIFKDDRKDYGETRWRAYGLLDDRLHALVFVVIDFDALRVISFRRANKREVKRHGR